MHVGIGLPADGIPRWAQAAEAAGFASLSCNDRLAYPTLDPFAALAGAAAVTSAITLRTAVLLGPLRPAAILAKSALTLDKLSEGRFELGLIAGARPDDYQAAGVDFHRRGATLDRQVAELVSVWGAARYGPRPAGGLRLLFGGSSPATWRRVAAHGAAWICGHGGPEHFRSCSAKLDQAWAQAGRPGRPRRLMASYFALGNEAVGHVAGHLGSYYGAAAAAAIAAATPTSAHGVRALAERFAAAGCDELVLIPCAAGLDQVELLAEAVGL